MRNLGTRNVFRHVSLQACLIVVFALLLAPGLAFGQTFVQQAQNLAGQRLIFHLYSRGDCWRLQRRRCGLG